MSATIDPKAEICTFDRLESWLRRRGADGWILAGGPRRLELVEQWRESASCYGDESKQALECLLALVREAWDNLDVAFTMCPDGHAMITVPRSDGLGSRNWIRDSLGEALVATLESAPPWWPAHVELEEIRGGSDSKGGDVG
jgi:hypothetical protein